jgi:hypothetical protein
MACYIASNNNRFYTALESAYGVVPNVNQARRFAAVELRARQRSVTVNRRDKTGGRTFLGLPPGLRRQTDFRLRTYLTAWDAQGAEPAQGPLFQSALGAPARGFAGASIASSGGSTLDLGAAHGLALGQAVTFGGELRFVTAVPTDQSIVLNAPFTVQPSSGSPLGATVTYAPGNGLPTISVFDYWSPETAVHRIVNGGAVNELKIEVNGDFHEFEFSGPCRDLIDSASFQEGEGGLTAFPAEPNIADFESQVIPGHLGQAWLGATPSKFLTLTEAEITLDNNIDLRDREFGSIHPRCLSAGAREVAVSFTLHEQDDNATKALYQAARTRSPISVMFQLGQQPGQLFGAYLPAVIPEVPEFDDSETRLQWRFNSSRAQGSVNDEVYLAFG